MPNYQSSVRVVTRSEPYPFAQGEGLASLGPIAVSGGARELSGVLVETLQAEGGQATLLNGAPQNYGTVILTEGLADLTATDRHWQVLDKCKRFKAEGVRIILLGATGSADARTLSGLPGLSRTLRQEWEGQSIVSWSLPQAASPTEQAALVVRALSSNFGDAELSEAGATIQQIGAVPRMLATVQTGQNVWFAPGGARGVTSACVIELARRQPGSVFVLAGRSAIAPWPDEIEFTTDMKQLRGALIAAARSTGNKPALPEIDRQARSLLAGQEIRAALDAIASAGAQPVYLQADMSDRDSIRTAVDRVLRHHGPITGLVHGAGVLADGLAFDKTLKDVAYVFGPKVEGLAILLDALDLSRLRHVGLFSSASAVFGNIGQSDYAMANAWLGAVARKLASDLPDVLVKSFCWGPWAGGMVDSALASHFTARGISLIGLEDGARIFADQMLQGERSEVELLIGDAWAE